MRTGLTTADGGHSKTWQCFEARYTEFGDYEGLGQKQIEMGIQYELAQ